MTVLWQPVVYQQLNLLLLEEIMDCVRRRKESPNVLFRASEAEHLDRILRYGTDRGGFPGGKLWRHSGEVGGHYLHEDIILATTEHDIRRGEEDREYSTSFKKLPGIADPLLLLYDAGHLVQMREKEYRFIKPDRKTDALIGIVPIQKLPAIDGWFSELEGLFYRSLARSVRHGTVVEVGVWKGRSTAFIGAVCQANGTRIICVDSWAGSSDAYNEQYHQALAREDVRGTFRQNMAARGIPIAEMNCSSSEAAGRLANEWVDLVFLDGSHDYRSVRRDAMEWFERLKRGGVLAGHDYNEKHEEVMVAAQEFANSCGSTLRRGPGAIWFLTKQ